MLSHRAAASIAIIVGGAIGALGAVLATRAEQPGARPTRGLSQPPLRPESIGPPDAPGGLPSSSVENTSASTAAETTGARAVASSSESGAPPVVDTAATTARRAGAPEAIAAMFTPIDDTSAQSRAEVACANGSASACQRLAMTYEAAGPNGANAARAERYQRLAIGMFVRGCRGLEADACYALAEMHATGRGMKQSESNARVLIERAQMLCRINNQQPVCASLNSAPAAAGRED